MFSFLLCAKRPLAIVFLNSGAQSSIRSGILNLGDLSIFVCVQSEYSCDTYFYLAVADRAFGDYLQGKGNNIVTAAWTVFQQTMLTKKEWHLNIE